MQGWRKEWFALVLGIEKLGKHSIMVDTEDVE